MLPVQFNLTNAVGRTLPCAQLGCPIGSWRRDDVVIAVGMLVILYALPMPLAPFWSPVTALDPSGKPSVFLKACGSL